MSGTSLFKKLMIGAKFDTNRFRADAEKCQVLKQHEKRKESGLKRKSHESENLPVTSPKKKKFNTEEDEQTVDHVIPFDQSDDNESEEELQVLGSLTSRRDVHSLDKTKKKKRKKKKLTLEKVAQIRQEEINHLRHVHNLHVAGNDIPDPLTSWEQLAEQYEIDGRIVGNVVQGLGYDSPTAIQRQAIPAMLQRRELLACAPTGSGKTAAFLIPIMQQLVTSEQQEAGALQVLVLAPTRELAQQIFRESLRLADGLDLRVACIEKVTGNRSRLHELQNNHIIVTTPKRLAFLLKMKTPVLSLKGLQWLVMDESDKLFEEGNYGQTGFRDQLAVIYSACSVSPAVRRALFSATFTHQVESWAKLNLDNLIEVYVGAKNSATRDIAQELVFVGTEGAKLLTLRSIIAKGIEPPVLLFVQSKDRAEDLYNELKYDNIHVDVIHGNRTQEQRDAAVSGFRSGSVWFLICTEVLGRGVDFKGVRLVINYDFPNSAIGYIHRIGRTGRAGRKGKAITFFTEKDKVNLRCIANVLHGAGCPVPEYMLHLKPPSKEQKRKLAKKATFRKGISTSLQTDNQSGKKKHRKRNNRNKNK